MDWVLVLRRAVLGLQSNRPLLPSTINWWWMWQISSKWFSSANGKAATLGNLYESKKTSLHSDPVQW